MGTRYSATCNQCVFNFTVSEGGGFVFHLLHCDKCGKDKSIGFDELGEIHMQYLKGLPGPYSIATSESDEDIKKNYPGEPISEEEYNKKVEEIVGKCKCGGKFSMDAPPRCSKCHSDDYETDEETMLCFD